MKTVVNIKGKVCIGELCLKKLTVLQFESVVVTWEIYESIQVWFVDTIISCNIILLAASVVRSTW